jgi:hypothetical protein
MRRPIHRHLPSIRGLTRGLRVAAVFAAGLSLAACQAYDTSAGTGGVVETLLFSPTFAKNRQNIPYTYNTPYDCRSFTGSGWKGIAGGRVQNFDQSYMISQAGCFKTQNECQAWLSFMRGYIDIPNYMRCNPHTA